MSTEIIKEESIETNKYSKSVTTNDEEKQNEAVQLVMRHTDYDNKTALDKLNEHNNDIQNIIREYMGLPIKTVETQKATSTNQTIYNEFRTFLDDASKSYRNKQQEN